MGNQDVALGIAQGLNGLANSFLQTKEVFNRDRELRLREQDQNMERELLAQKRKEEVEQKGLLFGAVAADSLLDMKEGEIADGEEIKLLSRNTPFTDGTSIVRVKREKGGVRPTFMKDGKEWESPELIPDSTLKKGSRAGFTKMTPNTVEQYQKMRAAIRGQDPDAVDWKDSVALAQKALEAIGQKRAELNSLTGDHTQEQGQLDAAEKTWVARLDDLLVKNGQPAIGMNLFSSKGKLKEEESLEVKNLKDEFSRLQAMNTKLELDDADYEKNIKRMKEINQMLSSGKAPSPGDAEVQDQQMQAYRDAVSKYTSGGTWYDLNLKGIGTREKKALDDMWIGMGRTLADAPHRGGTMKAKTDERKKEAPTTAPEKPAAKKKMSPEQMKKALEWLQKNPNHPDAAKVRELTQA
jgi:hypothetical protein